MTKNALQKSVINSEAVQVAVAEEDQKYMTELPDNISDALHSFSSDKPTPWWEELVGENEGFFKWVLGKEIKGPQYWKQYKKGNIEDPKAISNWMQEFPEVQSPRDMNFFIFGR